MTTKEQSKSTIKPTRSNTILQKVYNQLNSIVYGKKDTDLKTSRERPKLREKSQNASCSFYRQKSSRLQIPSMKLTKQKSENTFGPMKSSRSFINITKDGDTFDTRNTAKLLR